MNKIWNVKNTNIFVNDDLIPICANIINELRKIDNDRNVFTVNKKVIVFLRDNEKVLLKNLCSKVVSKFQKRG